MDRESLAGGRAQARRAVLRLMAFRGEKGFGSEQTQRIERTTPPSARKAAPFVADESGLATNATSAATSSGVAKRFRSEVGRAVVKNSFSTAAGVACLVLAKSSMNFSTPSERVGPASTELTVTPVPAVVSASPRASATCMVFVTP